MSLFTSLTKPHNRDGLRRWWLGAPLEAIFEADPCSEWLVICLRITVAMGLATTVSLLFRFPAQSYVYVILTAFFLMLVVDQPSLTRRQDRFQMLFNSMILTIITVSGTSLLTATRYWLIFWCAGLTFGLLCLQLKHSSYRMSAALNIAFMAIVLHFTTGNNLRTAFNHGVAIMIGALCCWLSMYIVPDITRRVIRTALAKHIIALKKAALHLLDTLPDSSIKDSKAALDAIYRASNKANQVIIEAEYSIAGTIEYAAQAARLYQQLRSVSLIVVFLINLRTQGDALKEASADQKAKAILLQCIGQFESMQMALIKRDAALCQMQPSADKVTAFKKTAKTEEVVALWQSALNNLLTEAKHTQQVLHTNLVATQL